MNQPGEWKNQDMGNGSGNDSVEVTVKGPSTNAIKDTVAKVEQKMKSVNGITNVKSDLSQTYDQYEIKVDQNKATEKGICRTISIKFKMRICLKDDYYS